jgi:mannan endo-1,4-beta-mannosidase
LGEIQDLRPFFDSEHGPIHLFKDRKVTLPELFDDEYFRHMQWAHFAAGGAGGGMRWPNRHPHSLTQGMRAAQAALARFLPLIDWQHFQRRNLNNELRASADGMALFGSAGDEQAVVWLLRTDTVGSDGRLQENATALPVTVSIPALRPGCYQVTMWDTRRGCAAGRGEIAHEGTGALHVDTAVTTDLAIAVRKV